MRYKKALMRKIYKHIGGNDFIFDLILKHSHKTNRDNKEEFYKSIEAELKKHIKEGIALLKKL